MVPTATRCATGKPAIGTNSASSSSVKGGNGTKFVQDTPRWPFHQILCVFMGKHRLETACQSSGVTHGPAASQRLGITYCPPVSEARWPLSQHRASRPLSLQVAARFHARGHKCDLQLPETRQCVLYATLRRTQKQHNPMHALLRRAGRGGSG